MRAAVACEADGLGLGILGKSLLGRTVQEQDRGNAVVGQLFQDIGGAGKIVAVIGLQDGHDGWVGSLVSMEPARNEPLY